MLASYNELSSSDVSQQLSSLSAALFPLAVVFFPPVNFVFRRELAKAEQSRAKQRELWWVPVAYQPSSSSSRGAREVLKSCSISLQELLLSVFCVYLRVPAGVHLQACICAGVCFKSLLQV